MKVLSLFDGISCGRVALERAGIPVEEYYASEIDKNAMAISAKNYPDIMQIKSVIGLEFHDGYFERGGMLWGGKKTNKIDLLIGGSPCQDLSIIKSKTRKGLDGEKSNLFWEYVRILEEVKPKYFILENNFSMRDEARDIISEALGVQPIMIDSGLISAQQRKRYYWTNIPNVQQPQGKGLLLKDILEDNIEEKYWYKQGFDFHGEDKGVCATLHINGHDILKRVHSKNSKCSTLTTCGGGNTQKKVYIDGRVRKLTPLEYERLQTLPDNYTAGFADTHRYSGCGNGWTVDVIAHILSFIPKN